MVAHPGMIYSMVFNPWHNLQINIPICFSNCHFNVLFKKSGFVNTLSAVIAQPAFCTGRIMVIHLLAHKLPYGHNID